VAQKWNEMACILHFVAIIAGCKVMMLGKIAISPMPKTTIQTKGQTALKISFIKKVGLGAIEPNRTINEIAQSHGVHPVQVSQWKKAHSGSMQGDFCG